MNARKLLDWRKLLIYSHRWMGIAGSLLFITWFFSGIAMMYWSMPAFPEIERLSHLPALDLTAARVAPGAAAKEAGITPSSLKVAMYYDGRPVYRFQNNVTVYADTGEVVKGRTDAEALDLVRRFEPEHAATIRYDTLLHDSDQWTLFEGPYSQMPLHRIAVGDPAATVYYVSAKTGEPVQKTDRQSRIQGFLSAVLHYVYFPPLKRQRDLWDAFIVWGSLAGCIMCLSGLVTGVWRYSVKAKFRRKGGDSHSPYSGWMKWHHYAGLIFGAVSFTWILSGGLSINPYGWLSSTSPTIEQRNAAAGGPLRIDEVTLDGLRKGLAALSEESSPREASVLQFRGGVYLAANRSVPYDPENSRGGPPERRIVSLMHPEAGSFSGFDEDTMMLIAHEAMPGAAIAEARWIEEYDNYYRSRDNSRALPVLRVRYADDAATWLYLDPSVGSIALKEDRVTRARRWLYNGLHSFDFPYLYDRRLLRDPLMIALSLGGLALSATTLLPMFRRLRRHAARVGRNATRFLGVLLLTITHT